MRHMLGPTRRLVVLVTALGVVACGKDRAPTPTEPDAPAEPAALTVTPVQAPPGTIVTLESPILQDAATDVASLVVTFDGTPSPLRRTPAGALWSVVPIDAAGPTGDAPPTEALTVELLQDDSTVARGPSALTVLELPAAPGAADTLTSALAEMTETLARLSGELEPSGSELSAYTEAVLAGLEALLVGDPEASLAARLEELTADDPDARILLDGVLSASGVIDATRDLADAFAEVSVEAASPRSPAPTADRWPMSRSEGTVLTDVALAEKMQFYVVAKLFGETVVSETAQEYGALVGLTTGSISMSVGVPAAGLVGAVLGVADFAVNKVFLGLFPAELSRFDLVLEDDLLAPGDTTSVRLDLEARNAPPPVGIQDFVGLTLDLLGLANGAGNLQAVESVREALLNAANFYLSTVRAVLARVASEQPELNLDVSFEVIPDMTWTAVAHDPRLVDMVTLTPDVVTPVDDDLNWHAAGPGQGEARVYARTSVDADAVLVDLPPGFTYTGGAFGESVATTDTRSLFVRGELALEVDFTDVIEEGDIAALEVRAGHLDAGGAPMWEPGIDVWLIVDGGTVEEEGGVTDADGQFVTLAQLVPGSDSMIVTVTATDESEQRAVQTVVAGRAPSGGSVYVTYKSSAAYAHAVVCCNFLDPAGTTDMDRITTTPAEPADLDVSVAAEASGTTAEGHTASATSALQHFTQLTYDPADSTLVSLRMVSSGSVDAEAGDPEQANADAEGSLVLELSVPRDATPFSVTAAVQHGLITTILLERKGTSERLVDVDYQQSGDSPPGTIDVSGVLTAGDDYRLTLVTHARARVGGGHAEGAQASSMDVTVQFGDGS